MNLDLDSDLSNYKFGPILGEGSFGKVYLVINLKRKKLSAIKEISKEHLRRNNKEKYTIIEKEVFNKVRKHPLFVQLINFFETDQHIYFELSYESNRDLSIYVKKLNGLKKETVQFYAAELILALEFLHRINIIHRDIKPENIMLKDNFHIALTDFGCAKFLEIDNNEIDKNQRSNSLVGSTQIVSPEIIIQRMSGKHSDIWSFGVVVYYLICNKWPFKQNNEYYTLEKIKKCELNFPTIMEEESVDLISSILKILPEERLGYLDGWKSVKNHSFFKNIKFDYIMNMNAPEEVSQCKLSKPDSIMRESFIKSCQLILKEYNFKYDNNDDDNLSKVPRCKLWDEYVCNNHIIRYGLVLKQKTKRHRKLKRVLILAQGPILVYVDAKSNKLKGKIEWDKSLIAEATSFDKFEIRTSIRCYYFEDVANDAELWVKAITDIHKATFH